MVDKNTTLEKFIQNYKIEEFKLKSSILDITCRDLEYGTGIFPEDDIYILRISIDGENDLYFKLKKEDLETKISNIEKSEYYSSFEDYEYIFKIGELELRFQIEE